jgi:hypothetical protein
VISVRVGSSKLAEPCGSCCAGCAYMCVVSTAMLFFVQSDLADPPVPWAPYLASFKAMLDKAQRRAAAAAAASSGASWAGSSSSRGDYEPADLVTVTVHPAGPGSKAAKAAAAAAVGGGVTGKAAASGKVGSKANKSGRVR